MGQNLREHYAVRWTSRPESAGAGSRLKKMPSTTELKRSDGLHKRAVIICLGLITLTGALLRLYNPKSFYYDEFFSISMAQAKWRVFWQVLHHDANMLLYYLLLRAWIHIGTGEFAIRLLSVSLGIVTIVAIFLVGKRLFGVNTGLIAAGLLAFNGFHIMYSQQVRSYSLLALLTVLSFWALVEAVESGASKQWVVYGVLVGLAFYAHFLAVLTIASQAAALLARGTRKACWKGMLAAGATALLMGLPMVVFIALNHQLHGSQIPWIPTVGVAQFWQMLRVLTGDGGNWLPLAFLVLAVCSIWSVGKSAAKWNVVLCCCGFLIPLLLAFAVSVKQPAFFPHWLHKLEKPVFVPRFLIASIVPLTLLTAAGIASLPRTLRFAVAAIMLAIVLWPLAAYYRWKGYNDWHSVVAYLQKKDGITSFEYPSLAADFVYYAPNKRAAIPFEGAVAEWWHAETLEHYPAFLSQLRSEPRLWIVDMDEPTAGYGKLRFYFGTSHPWQQGPEQVTSELVRLNVQSDDPVAKLLVEAFPYVYEKRLPGLKLKLFSKTLIAGGSL